MTCLAESSEQPQSDLRDREVYECECVRYFVSILCLSEFTAACTCEPFSVCVCVCVGSTLSRLRSDSNDDSVVVAELESSHVLDEGTGPLIFISQSRRGCWEQAVLGNDLAGGPRNREHIEGPQKGRKRCVGTECTGRMDAAGSKERGIMHSPFPQRQFVTAKHRCKNK